MQHEINEAGRSNDRMYLLCLYRKAAKASANQLPTTYHNSSASSPSSQSTQLPEAAAAATVTYCAATDSVDINANDSSKNVSNIYDTIDNNVPTTSQSLPASSRPTDLSPSSPEAAAEASSSVDPDSIYIHPPINSSDYMLMTRSPTSSSPQPSSQPTPVPPSAPAAAAAASSSINENNVDSTNDVPCLYELELNTKPTDGAFTNPLYDADVGQ